MLPSAPPYPPRACSLRHRAGDLARPLERGITVAGQHRNHTGFAATTPAGEYVPDPGSLLPAGTPCLCAQS
jgi:hypothetical protein